MKWLTGCVTLVVLWTLVRNRSRQGTFVAVVRHPHHDRIFAYLTSAENWKVLNPTITGLHVIGESKNGFSVSYTERLSQLPFVSNTAEAEYQHELLADGSYLLTSEHSTCFLMEYFCVPTTSSIRLKQVDEAEVEYKEEIHYNCPLALSQFCFNEVLIQRRHVVGRLKRIFEKST